MMFYSVWGSITLNEDRVGSSFTAADAFNCEILAAVLMETQCHLNLSWTKP